MRGQFMEDRQGRFSAEDIRRQQAESDRAARFGAEDVMYGRYGDERGLISSGEAQRVLDQRALDMAYADFLDQRMYPQEMVNFALGALSGTPYSTRNRSYQLGSSFTQNPSVYGQLISGLGAGYSAYRMANDQ